MYKSKVNAEWSINALLFHKFLKRTILPVEPWGGSKISWYNLSVNESEVLGRETE